MLLSAVRKKRVAETGEHVLRHMIALQPDFAIGRVHDDTRSRREQAV